MFGLGYWVAPSHHAVTISQSTSLADPHDASQEPVTWLHDKQLLDYSDLLPEHMRANTGVSPSALNISAVSSDQVAAWVERLPAQEVERQLKRLFVDADLAQIEDKKFFARRLAEEVFAVSDTTTPLVGRALVSTTAAFPSESAPLTEVSARQAIFAHFDTYGKVPHNGQVFVRWQHRDTGQLLLFTKKNITADTAQNWVSYRPDQAWKVGYYDVKYYQFSDHLEPIAQVSYLIQRVLD